MTKKQRKMRTRILVCVGALALLFLGEHLFSPLLEPFRFLAYLLIYFWIGHDILRKALQGIGHGQIFDESFLMALATVGAFLLALYEGSGDYLEGIAVMLFYQVGELFQSIAVGKSRKSIAALMDIRPDYANVEEGTGLIQVDPEEVPLGAVIVIQPGERVPLDGVILEGSSSLDTACLTGESVPRTVRPGDEIVSGAINKNGLLKVRTTKAYGDSTVARILELVENSGERKSRPEAFITRFARVYTPAVVIGALLLALLPPLFLMGTGGSPSWDRWIYRALTFLVISCPCALVISIPLSFFGGIGGAGRAGILIKGSSFLETLSKVKTLVFDKTGTLTQGVFQVVDIHRSPLETPELLEWAAHAESASSHPISKSLLKAYGKEVDRTRIKKTTDFPGEGIVTWVDDREIACGNKKLMERLQVSYHECHSVGTIIHMAMDRNYMGHIVISDLLKPYAKQAMAELKELGVEKLVMLTGDKKAVAEPIGKNLGMDEVHFELLPDDKVRHFEELLTQPGPVGFVGDGINDAPVLARADVGIGMGALGSDAAIEAADVVLMDDNPQKIPTAIRIARKTLRIVYENIVFALGIKFAFLALGALGLSNMWMAIFADVGVMVLAVLNAMRAMKIPS